MAITPFKLFSDKIQRPHIRINVVLLYGNGFFMEYVYILISISNWFIAKQNLISPGQPLVEN